jgi:predicted AAA+ superfamily ATPase
MTEHFEKDTPLEDYVHTRFTDLFHQYLIVGGMPEPVSRFVETGNMQAVRSIQSNIVMQYRQDITRYSAKKDLSAIKRIYDLIPSELNQQNKRFIIKNIDGKAKYNRNEDRFLWLVDANVALAAYNVQEPRHPLLISMMSSYFKLFLSDVGLLTCLCGMDVVRDMLNNRIGVNYGALYENAVAQELTAHGHRLYYFKSKRMGEIDFVIEHGNAEVALVEVKSGKDYKRHRALDNVLGVASYDIRKAYVLHEGNLSVESAVRYLPIYMVSCL